MHHSYHLYLIIYERLTILSPVLLNGASLMDQIVKNLLAMQETWARSLGLEDPLEKGMITHSRGLPRLR